MSDQAARARIPVLLCVCAIALMMLARLGDAAAQRGEFLTDGEIYQIREAQEPDKRLKLYAQFAEERLKAVEKLLAGNEERRGLQINDYLREYDRIIDAIDQNVEEHMRKRSLMRKGLESALKTEPEMLKMLESFRARNPKDLDEYRFILNQAIETTQSSLEGLREALGKQPKGRKEEKEAREEQKRAREPEKGSTPEKSLETGKRKKG